MSGAWRTTSGGRVDRTRPVRFTFDGRHFTGLAGDTLASALVANGVHLVGRSFKYHRPRGFLGAGAEEPNALVEVVRGDRRDGRTTPNLRATQIELYDGLAAWSQNHWPSLAFDLGAVGDYLPSGLLAAGFYYKTFMGPGAAWQRFYEPLIRRAAGLGRAPRATDPDHYAQRYAHCDVLVVGGGAAGLAAALAAGGTGARVILCDEQAELGGGLLSERQTLIEGTGAAAWVGQAVASLAARAGVTLLPRTQAFGYYAQNLVGLAERVTEHQAAPDPRLPRERLWKVRARQVVLATGAIERPLVFPDNDRPGIMLASAAQTYANRYGARPGGTAVVFTADDSGYAAARDLADAGVEVATIVDVRSATSASVGSFGLPRGTSVLANAAIVGTTGRLRVTAVRIGKVGRSGEIEEGGTITCDLVAMAGGWTPNVALFSQSRGRLRFDDTCQHYVPGEPAQAVHSVGACSGTFDLGAALAEGADAGATAARKAGHGPAPTTHSWPVTGAVSPAGGVIGALPHPFDARRVKAFVDFQNDVTAKDISLAVQEGFRSIEHVKRYTTTGMATDQGKTSGMSALAIAADALHRPIPEVGLTSFRPPWTPVTFGALAGRSRGAMFDPVRQTPMRAWADAHGAVFEDVGLWKRARWFPQVGEDMARAVQRECRSARSGVGLFDASTLGKIEVVGPDAAMFLERLYTNPFRGLGVGRCRYGIMLTEAGFVMDDGVIGRLAPDRFHVTTTTGGAARVLAHMEDYLQTEFTDLRVWLTSVTEQWAVIAVQGPRAREVVEPLVAGLDLGAMPHMSVDEGTIRGLPIRLFRISFTGELGYEINVPAAHGPDVWEAVWAAGQPFGITAYGTEAMHVLRAEKGFIIVGQETDGTVTPGDLGLDWAIGKAKGDFIGKRALLRPDLVAAGRRHLVGLLTLDPRVVLEEGAQITAALSPAPGTAALGHVTSAYWSETLGHSIALALVAGGRSRTGETLYVPMPSGNITVTVADPVFLDKRGERLEPVALPTAPLHLPREGEDPRTDAPARRPVPLPGVAGPRVRGGDATRVALVETTRPGLCMAAAPAMARLILRGDAAVARTAGAAFGPLLPLAPCCAAMSGARSALWLGPDEWLLLDASAAGDAAADALRQTLGHALAGMSHSIVDISHRQHGIVVAGARAAYALAAFVPLDLDLVAFPAGMATRTLFEKAEVVLWRPEPETFHLEVTRSFVPYVSALLRAAAIELAASSGTPSMGPTPVATSISS